MISRRKSFQLMAGAGLLGCNLTANAQDTRGYPDRPIRLMVAKPPGGLDDTVARAIQSEVEKALRQPVVIENIGGAQGIIGTQNLIRAQPDGYKIMLVNTKLQVTAGVVMDKTPYDLTKDVTRSSRLPAIGPPSSRTPACPTPSWRRCASRRATRAKCCTPPLAWARQAIWCSRWLPSKRARTCFMCPTRVVARLRPLSWPGKPICCTRT